MNYQGVFPMFYPTNYPFSLQRQPLPMQMFQFCPQMPVFQQSSQFPMSLLSIPEMAECPVEPANIPTQMAQTANPEDQGDNHDQEDLDEVSDARQDRRSRNGHQNYLQNPKRNVITSIGNQLFSFISNKSKVWLALHKLSKRIGLQTITALRNKVTEIKKTGCSYLNFKKLKNMWYPPTDKGNDQEIQQLFRKLSYYYLIEILRLKVLKSRRMSKEIRRYYIHGLRQLIDILRNVPIAKCSGIL